MFCFYKHMIEDCLLGLRKREFWLINLLALLRHIIVPGDKCQAKSIIYLTFLKE